jgi:hypothetical protein
MPLRYVQTAQGEIEIFPSRLKLLGLVMGSVLLIACSYLALRSPDLVHRVFGVFGAGFFGLAGAFAFYRLIVPRPAVRLTPNGIFDNSSLLAAGFVPWADIAFVTPITVSQSRMLGFFLKDPASFARSRSWPKACILRLNLRLGFPVVSVPEVALPGRIDEFALELAARFPVRVEGAA